MGFVAPTVVRVNVQPHSDPDDSTQKDVRMAVGDGAARQLFLVFVGIGLPAYARTRRRSQRHQCWRAATVTVGSTPSATMSHYITFTYQSHQSGAR